MKTSSFDASTFVAQDSKILPVFSTANGTLFSGDCLKILPCIKSESVDTVFADPPFNLGKKYGPSRMIIFPRLNI